MVGGESYVGFRAPWWGWALVLAGCAATAGLSYWQYQRGLDKQDRREALLAAATADPRPLPASGPAPPAARPMSVTVTGRWAGDAQLLVERRFGPGGREAGVLTPFETEDGRLLLVHRGYLPESGFERDGSPARPRPGSDGRVTGLWRALPEAGIVLGNPDCAPAESSLLTMNHPRAADLQCAYPQAELVDGLLMLAADHPAAFEVRQRVGGLPPERHLAYAFQWAALCIAIALTFYFVNRMSSSR